MTLGLFDPAFLGGLATGGGGYDADAQDFINRVIAADVSAGNTSGLEVGVQDAYNSFFVGCKADGNLSALKASCILAGARTLNGAVTPLVSTMPTPTNNGPFVPSDYDRETGLKGNGSTKYLDTNRADNADPQNNKHLACYVSQLNTALAALAGTKDDANSLDSTQIVSNPSNNSRMKINSDLFVEISAPPVPGFYGGSRNSSTTVFARANSVTVSGSSTSATPPTRTIWIFARNSPTVAVHADARISFYSLGESVNLALLDARVTTLMSDLAAAIP